MNEATLRILLHRIVAEAPTPAPIDVERVVALSEAHRRRRTWSVVAAAAGAVLLVTLSAAGLAAGAHTGRAAPAADRGVTVAYSLPATAPARFDPTRARLIVTGIPGDLTVRGTSVRGERLSLSAADERDASVVISLGAKGHDAPEHSAAAQPGPPIRGNASQWDDGEQTLRWQWAPGAWGVVTVRNRENPLELATRVARSASLDLDARTTLPYTVTTPPGYRLAEFLTATADHGGEVSATITFGGPAATFISVTANPLGAGLGAPAVMFAGRPARITEDRDHTTVVMAAGDLKVTGTCGYRPIPTLPAEDFRELCRTTTASAAGTADLRTPESWPPYTPR